MTEVLLVKDDSSHQFLIPVELKPAFDKLMEDISEYDESMFRRNPKELEYPNTDMFNQYMVGGTLPDLYVEDSWFEGKHLLKDFEI
jgi:hypothetical protein